MANPSSPSPSWVILNREISAADLPEGHDLSLAIAAPPRVTFVTLHQRVLPVDPELDPTDVYRPPPPRVLAADPSGLVLLLLPPPPPSLPGPRTQVVLCDDDGVEVEDTVEIIYVSLDPQTRYFVCDVTSASASPVLDHDTNMFFDDHLGVIAAPGGGGHYMLVSFKYDDLDRNATATLLCFSSETGNWFEKVVDNPRPHWSWTFHDVVSHGGKLWWVDRRAGLLSCDPFADRQLHMMYVPKPVGHVDDDHDCSYCSREVRDVSNWRCVQLSNGKFRCVEMGCAGEDAPKIFAWTLADPGTAQWMLEHEVSFAEIWAGESYKAAELPEKAPVLAVIHPKNPDVVYFFLEDHLFGVDLRAREVVGCEPYELDEERQGSFSSRCVLPWELPPAFPAAAGLVAKDASSGSNEEESTSSASTVSSVSQAQEALSQIKLEEGA